MTPRRPKSQGPLTSLPPLSEYPGLYSSYVWNRKHAFYGYEADSLKKGFPWIQSLEKRFLWLRLEHLRNDNASAAPYLIREMIQWGGSQYGALQKFDEGLDRVCLRELIRETVRALPKPKSAIEWARKIPGLGLTYGSKLLRFLDPSSYGALDDRIRASLFKKRLRNSASNDCYVDYLEQLHSVVRQLGEAKVRCPRVPNSPTVDRTWQVAKVEMALFQLSSAMKK
jgi:hypothetical protein